MVFSSYVFLLLFLPATVLGFYLIKAKSRYLSLVWLVLASAFFYGFSNPLYLLLIGVSIAVNFSVGKAIARTPNRRNAKWLMIGGVTFNLALLGYFKYADFLLENFNGIFGASVPLTHIILPLAISFFTFQQIAFLVDSYRSLTKEYRLIQYALFVLFFPQLIAGPIVHHKDIIPQFDRLKHRIKPQIKHIAVGMTILGIGLFKKVAIADHLAFYANQVFDGAAG
ncbi:MAG: MBOAT family protein, partial [Helicobacteraceae bacterium]|nr:MBOAT family protein [Helicobacteraceae bacterium]